MTENKKDLTLEERVQVLAQIAKTKDLTTTKTSDDKNKQDENNIEQLNLYLPENTRAVCNATVRTALFSAISGENRTLLNKTKLAAQGDIEIIFTGLQLNQDDLNVFMQLIYMADTKPLGEDFIIPANDILTGLGRANGKSQHEQLKNEIHRLVTGTINLKFNGINYIGHLIDYAAQDETLPSRKRHWCFKINRQMTKLFYNNQFTIIDWEQRKKLKQKDLASWLHLYYSTHANPFPVSVQFLFNKSGSKTKDIRYFRKNLKKALIELEKINFFNQGSSIKSDLVHVEHVKKNLLSKTKSSHIAPTEHYLNYDVIENFKSLYPRFDVCDCKTAFDNCISKNKIPENYDIAFMAYAKKWVHGK